MNFKNKKNISPVAPIHGDNKRFACAMEDVETVLKHANVYKYKSYLI